MADALIFDAVRTPRGRGLKPRDEKPGGALYPVLPQDLVGTLVDALRERLGAAAVNSARRLLLGCVGQVGDQGGHVALASRIAAGLPDAVVPKSINNFCVSGLSTVIEAAHWVQADEQGLCLAGGVEMMSRVPFLADRATWNTDPELIQRMGWLAPVLGAELVATREGFTGPELDALVLRSHQRASAAWEAGHYKRSVIPVKDAEGEVLLERDEWIRPNLTAEALAAMAPAFADLGASGQDALALQAFPDLATVEHVHTLAHCPGISDGAALVVVGSEEAGRAAGLRPRARIRAVAEAAGDASLQFGAGLKAMDQVLERSGASLNDMDLVEFMEAFAAPALWFERRYEPDLARVNVNGGHLAMGHPMGATGAILLTTLLDELDRRDAETGLVVTLAGGGLGAALLIERV
ncbi:MAG: acetyl-CoA C-acyltransferase [Pseudomonadota bacterium]